MTREAVIVDAEAPGLSLDPFFKLMANERVMKVFHAARQDIEIVYHRGGLIPHPVFDTQVAAMVCGFGEAARIDQALGAFQRHTREAQGGFQVGLVERD